MVRSRFREPNPTKVMSGALIFDFDGVIVNTEPLHYAAFQRVLAPLGLGFPWSAYVEFYIGFDDRRALREMFARAQKPLADGRLAELAAAKAAAFLEAARDSAPAPYPGVRAWLDAARGRVPLGLCSGAVPGDIHPILERLGLDGSFDALVTAADVPASKPDPASYHLAMDRLTAHAARPLRAQDSWAVEDTPAGIAAAQGAGLRVLAVATTYEPAALTAADRIVTALTDLDPEPLLRAMEGTRP